MDSDPLLPEGDPESWDEMAARVAGEVADVVNLTYATSLSQAMKAYLMVGFSHDQAFQLTLVEHRTRMDLLTTRAVLRAADEDSPPDA